MVVLFIYFTKVVDFVRSIVFSLFCLPEFFHGLLYGSHLPSFIRFANNWVDFIPLFFPNCPTKNEWNSNWDILQLKFYYNVRMRVITY